MRPDPGAALLALYDTALPHVYGYLLARCGRRALAEDLTADTFLAAVVACRRGPLPAQGVGWLVGIARHELLDHWRSTEREERGLRAASREHGPGRPALRVDPWDAHVDALLAREVLAAQSAPHRAALTLRYLDGLPVREVASCLGRTAGATEVLLVRAKRAFRAAYEGGGDHGEEER